MLNKNDRVEYVVLEGSPFDRGIIHGQSLKKEILELFSLWKMNLGQYFSTAPDAYIAKFLDNTDYITAIKKYTPDLYEEVEGLAEGSGIDFNAMITFQMLDEFLLNSEDIHGKHCSSIGTNRVNGKPVYLAQNWDIGGYLDGFQTVLHIKNEGSDVEAFVFTYAGFIAACGMNNKGVGICVNSLPQLNYAKGGLPIAFVIRGVLNQLNQEDAIEFLHEIKHASPQNYLIGGPESFVDFECSANSITPFKVADSSAVVYHTNHPLINTDYNAKHLDYLKEHEEEEINNDNSHTRLYALEKRLSIPLADITIDVIKSALSSHDSDKHPICMNYKDAAGVFNLGSTVMVLSERPEFHVALGPPDVTPFDVYRFGEQ